MEQVTLNGFATLLKVSKLTAALIIKRLGVKPIKKYGRTHVYDIHVIADALGCTVQDLFAYGIVRGRLLRLSPKHNQSSPINA